MSTIPTITITPSTAANAYAKVDRGDTSGAGSFGSVLQNALDGAIETGHTAETSAMQAISGEGNLTDVVTALSRAELALQTATAIRDRVVSAYQDIMKMPI
ncbi:MAG TPA: flagellar hook-basal body complex protein FliE [Acetobacteraceae bacterium]|jgi:flagellar hook-basal body complex protein FliE